MGRLLPIVFVLLMLTVFGIYYFNFNKDFTIEEYPRNIEENVMNASDKKLFTLDEVAKHNTSNDCWIVIHGKVYNVTEFIPQHPGGPEVIIQNCGRDVTELFETRPMGSGTPHSQEARELLESYYIGDLAT